MNCPHCEQPLSVMRNAYCPDCHGALQWHGGMPRVPRYARASGTPRSNVAFWMVVWSGTVAAGGVFGLLLGSILGLDFGYIIAGLVGIPIVATTAALSWVCWLSRFRIAVACLAGLLTGVVATLPLYGTTRFGDSQAIMLAIVAGFIGMAGSGSAGAMYWRRGPSSEDASPPRWQYSLGDLFLRMTVVSVLFAAWSALFRFLGTGF